MATLFTPLLIKLCLQHWMRGASRRRKRSAILHISGRLAVPISRAAPQSGRLASFSYSLIAILPVNHDILPTHHKPIDLGVRLLASCHTQRLIDLDPQIMPGEMQPTLSQPWKAWWKPSSQAGINDGHQVKQAWGGNAPFDGCMSETPLTAANNEAPHG